MATTTKKTTKPTVAQVTRAASVELFRQTRAARQLLNLRRSQEAHGMIYPETVAECTAKLAALTTALGIVRRESQHLTRRETVRANYAAQPPKLTSDLVEEVLSGAASAAEQYVMERVTTLYGDEVACSVEMANFDELLREEQYELLDQLREGLAEQARTAKAMKAYDKDDLATVQRKLREARKAYRTAPLQERAAKHEIVETLAQVLKARRQ